MSAPVAEGDILAGKYRVERVLGQGGMGLVVAAMHLQLKERVALKFLLPSAAVEPEFAARFQREAQLMAKLRSEHVARVSDVGVLENGSPYMVMEYLEGTDLREILREIRPLPFDVALDYILQACEGIAEAHSQGIVHRDIKPTNLFVTQRRDGSALVKVLDFGISKGPGESAKDDQLTGVAAVLGSPKYMPPEQLRSSRSVDGRADVWALGAILQEMLTGEPPFTGPNATAVCAAIIGDPPTALRSKRPDLSEELEAVLLRCFEKEPDARQQNVAQLAEEVVRAAAPEDAAAQLMVERIARMASPSAALSSTTTGRRALLGRSGTNPSAISRSGGVLVKTGQTPISSATAVSTGSTSRSGGTTAPKSGSTPAMVTGQQGDTSVSAPWGDAATKPAGTRRVGIGVVIAIVLLGGAVVLFTALRPGAQAGVAPASSAPPPPVSVAVVPSASAAVPVAISASAVPVPSPPPADTIAQGRDTRGGGRGVSGGGGPPPKKTAEAPPTVTAPPAVTPPPPPTKDKPIANPLEDRQ